MAKWTKRTPKSGESGKSLERVYDAIIANLLICRGIKDSQEAERFFDPDFDLHLHDPFLFVDMPKIVDRVRTALENKERVGIFGDFDADGVTGSALLREGLEGLEFRDIVVHIPDKTLEGHGISMQGIEKFSREEVTLLFTVDCGVANVHEVEEAKKLGIDVIIIDHHHVPTDPPNALAIINPKMDQCGYPFSGLCGAGAAFKVLQGLYEKLAPNKVMQLKWLLDLAAIGTVADCMPLTDENRVLVKYGLIVLAKTRRPGLQELFSVGNIRVDEVSLPDATTIGFQIAPRINAAGRMAHALTAHNLLLEHDRNRARELSQELESYNRQRQKITTTLTEEVRALVQQDFQEKKFIFASAEHYPLGIVGLVAGKIAQEFGKPTAILQKGKEMSQGSFRSIPGLNIVKAIEQCSDILERFGGHEQAAGIVIQNKNVQNFANTLNAIIEEELRDIIPEPELFFDTKLPSDHIHLDLARNLKKFEPFGQENPEPLFHFSNLELIEMRMVGNGAKHIKVSFKVAQSDGNTFVLDGIGFGLGALVSEIRPGDNVELIGALQENIWNGRSSLQIRIEDMRKVEG